MIKINEEAVTVSMDRETQLLKIYNYILNPGNEKNTSLCHWQTANKIRERNNMTDIVVILGISKNKIFHSYLIDSKGKSLINSGDYGNPDITFTEKRISIPVPKLNYTMELTYIEFITVQSLFDMFATQIEESVNNTLVIGEDIKLPDGYNSDNVSDGYHTFDELYEFRKIYNAALFNEWYSKGLYDVHKSMKHNDGEKCFGKDDMFIVCAQLPTGQISNHYNVKDWDLFKCEESETAKNPFDGHTPQDVLDRITNLIIGIE